MLLLTGLAVVAVGLWSPDLAILVGQAAAVGLLCVVLARVLHAVLGPRSGRTMVLREPSSASSSGEAKSTEPHVRYEGSSHATTATIPALSAPHSEPSP
jgi:hypothetical protein